MAPNENEAGYTVLEITVALVILSIIMASVYGVYQYSYRVLIGWQERMAINNKITQVGGILREDLYKLETLELIDRKKLKGTWYEGKPYMLVSRDHMVYRNHAMLLDSSKFSAKVTFQANNWGVDNNRMFIVLSLTIIDQKERERTIRYSVLQRKPGDWNK